MQSELSHSKENIRIECRNNKKKKKNKHHFHAIKSCAKYNKSVKVVVTVFFSECCPRSSSFPSIPIG